MSRTDACPCGSGQSCRRCCEPLHTGEVDAETAEALMRSRYSAYAVADLDYLWRSWHPRTRPERIEGDPDVTWTGLEILDVVGGGPGETEGEVEFRAHYRSTEESGATWVLQERSRFTVRAGRWFYVDGQDRD